MGLKQDLAGKLIVAVEGVSLMSVGQTRHTQNLLTDIRILCVYFDSMEEVLIEMSVLIS